tara:strand:+ start:21154 stop:21534 length:381 start_codon:yes stop_codon:yes gene_type:complete
MIELYTVQISNVNNIDDETIEVLDTTVKSGYGMLAPTWNMVWDFKSGELSWRDYTRRYLEMMRESLSANRPLWSKLFSNNTSGNRKIALACYCKPNACCHRYLLRDFIIDWKSSEGEEILDMGELL